MARHRDALINTRANAARSSVVVSAGQLGAALMGGVFAILVSLIVGAGQRTDGFLAGYSA